MFLTLKTKFDIQNRIIEPLTGRHRDFMLFPGIRKSETLVRLLKMLAYQIGQEVSYASIAKDFGMSIQTIENYVDVLEKAYIVFRLNPFVGNGRSGIKKMRKIYFWDGGIRNALIESFIINFIEAVIFYFGESPALYHFYINLGNRLSDLIVIWEIE